MKHQHQHQNRVPIWLVLLGMLAMASWYHIRSSHNLIRYQDGSISSYSSRSSSSSSTGYYSLQHAAVAAAAAAAAALPGCEAAHKPAVALMMVILGHDNATRHDQYWMAVANRRAYAIQHGYPLYLVTDTLGSGEHPAWEKLVALQAVLKHSCADWVWMNDADAYIMNFQRDILDLAQNPLQHRNPKQICNTSTPDIIVSGACLTRINTGSMLWRNTDWTKQFVSDAWHSKFIARPANWWDQAAILHMYKVGDTKKHMCIVKARSLNAFTNVTNCHDGAGTFKEGDLLVHFPGGMKTAISSMDSKWLQSVPLLPSKRADASARPPWFTVTRASSQPATEHGQVMHVSMHSQLYDKNSTMQRQFELYVEPQLEGFGNWGWPIAPEPVGFKALLQKQVLQRQQEQQSFGR